MASLILDRGVRGEEPPPKIEAGDGCSLRKMERDRFMEAGGGRKEAREGELSLVVARYSFPPTSTFEAQRNPFLRLRSSHFVARAESNGAAVMPWNWDEFAYIEMAKSPGRWSLLGRVGGRMKRPFSPL